MIEASSIFETSVNFTRLHGVTNSEDSHLHTRRRENLKSHLVCLLLSLRPPPPLGVVSPQINIAIEFNSNEEQEPPDFKKGMKTEHYFCNL
jgi:hypothetical protein